MKSSDINKMRALVTDILYTALDLKILIDNIKQRRPYEQRGEILEKFVRIKSITGKLEYLLDESDFIHYDE